MHSPKMDRCIGAGVMHRRIDAARACAPCLQLTQSRTPATSPPPGPSLLQVCMLPFKQGGNTYADCMRDRRSGADMCQVAGGAMEVGLSAPHFCQEFLTLLLTPSACVTSMAWQRQRASHRRTTSGDQLKNHMASRGRAKARVNQAWLPTHPPWQECAPIVELPVNSSRCTDPFLSSQRQQPRSSPLPPPGASRASKPGAAAGSVPWQRCASLRVRW